MSAEAIRRRELLLGAVGATVLAACATPGGRDDTPPIVFVPGNGDTAALWVPTIWRFESNGWPRERLHAIDMPYPLARDDDAKAQPGRSSTAEHMAYLSAEVRKVLAATGAKKVVLVGNSRGGYAIRNFVANGGGAALVSHAILGGVPNHGVYANPARAPGGEFNGAGPFLTALNRPGPDGNEVTPGVAWLTIRSDRNDKYAQPDGALLGAPGMATGVSFDGPALKGAENVVLAGVDHRETSFSPQAFAATYRFITGRAPATLAIVPEGRVVLDGVVSGLGLDNRQGDFATNLPLAGATIEVYAVDAATGERRGGAVHTKTIGSDGRWGPFVGDGSTRYEFMI
nr:alpha/beta fold hydrolase [Caldimonas sp.]